jgi:hypothetical protein
LKLSLRQRRNKRREKLPKQSTGVSKKFITIKPWQ